MSHDDPPPEPAREMPEPGRLVVFAVLFEGALAPLALVLGGLLGHHPLATFAFSAHGALTGVLATLPMLALLAAIMRWPVGPLGRIKRFCDDHLVPFLRPCAWSDFALVSLAAGVGEELLFRGAVQATLVDTLGPGPGLLAASLIFGVLHAITPTYAVLATLLGAYLGGVWMLTGNLLTVMIAHALYDFVALLALVRTSARTPP